MITEKITAGIIMRILSHPLSRRNLVNSITKKHIKPAVKEKPILDNCKRNKPSA
jgi:hypothetical protein